MKLGGPVRSARLIAVCEFAGTARFKQVAQRSLVGALTESPCLSCAVAVDERFRRVDGPEHGVPAEKGR